MESHWVYWLLNTEKETLYIGYTTKPGTRFVSHAQLKDWWPEVRDIRLKWFATRQEALDVERISILEEKPVHNTARYPTIGGVTKLRAVRISDALWDAIRAAAKEDELNASEYLRGLAEADLNRRDDIREALTD